jgi:hypothetical protein
MLIHAMSLSSEKESALDRDRKGQKREKRKEKREKRKDI